MNSGRMDNSETYSLAINPHFHNNDKLVMCPADGWLSLLSRFRVTITNKYECAAGGLRICAGLCFSFLKRNIRLLIDII